MAVHRNQALICPASSLPGRPSSLSVYIASAVSSSPFYDQNKMSDKIPSHQQKKCTKAFVKKHSREAKGLTALAPIPSRKYQKMTWCEGSLPWAYEPIRPVVSTSCEVPLAVKRLEALQHQRSTDERDEPRKSCIT